MKYDLLPWGHNIKLSVTPESFFQTKPYLDAEYINRVRKAEWKSVYVLFFNLKKKKKTLWNKCNAPSKLQVQGKAFQTNQTNTPWDPFRI